MIQSRFYYFCIRDASVIASLCKSSGFCLVLFERPAKVRRFVRRRPFRCGMNEMAAFFLFRLQQQQEIIENKKTRDSVSDSMASDSMLFHFSIQKKKRYNLESAHYLLVLIVSSRSLNKKKHFDDIVISCSIDIKRRLGFSISDLSPKYSNQTPNSAKNRPCDWPFSFAVDGENPTIGQWLPKKIFFRTSVLPRAKLNRFRGLD